MLTYKGYIADAAVLYAVLIVGDVAINMECGYLDHHQGKEGKN